jgi:starch synthase (maltosyl-transferring)
MLPTTTARLTSPAMRCVLAIRGAPWMELTVPGKRPGLTAAGRASPVQIQFRSDRWLDPRWPPHIEQSSDSVATFVWSFAQANVIEEYRGAPTHIERRLTVVNTSSTELQLTGVRLNLPGLRLGSPVDCRIEAPATSLRPRLPMAGFFGIPENAPCPPGLSPAAVERWGVAVEDAPDATPGLLAIHNHRLAMSFLLWYHSLTESGSARFFGDNPGVTLGHQVGLAGWLAPGAGLSAGTQYLALVEGSWHQALRAFRRHYARAGIVPPSYGSPPAWVRQSAVYEVHPGQYGGFSGLSAELPRLSQMGINVLYLLPVMQYDNRSGIPWDENWVGSGSPYAMKDFEAFEPSLGTEQDFHNLVQRAHALGMRVLMDFVAQGCALDARYVRDHPEWFCRDEAGRMVSSHGWRDTLSLDWANPDYQDYMTSWALRFARQLDVDGYRIDAPHAKEPNWDRSLPYNASYTGLGLLPMLERLQQGLKAISPSKAMLCEAFGPVFVKSHDFQYDYHPCVNLYSLFRGDLSADEMGEWFRDYWEVMPPGAVRLSFTETHDTRTGMDAYAWRGSQAVRAMFAILILAGFVPMIWSGQEAGLEGFYRSALEARAASPALLGGERLFNSVGCSSPDVLSIVCHSPGEIVWGLVSLHAERAPLRFTLPRRLDLTPSRDYQLVDLLSHQPWGECGQTSWKGEALRRITLSPYPFVPHFFRIEPAEPPAPKKV